MAVGTESQKRDDMAVNVAVNGDLSNVNMSESEGNPDEDTVDIKEEVVDVDDSYSYENLELDGRLARENENNHDSDTEMQSEVLASSISNGSAVQLTDSGDGGSELQAFMVEKEKWRRHVRIVGEPFIESNNAPDKEVLEEDTKHGLADIIASNPVALENGDVRMPTERENLKRIREEVGGSDVVDVKDEVKMEIVDEEIEERPHKKQKLVSCL